MLLLIGVVAVAPAGYGQAEGAPARKQVQFETGASFGNLHLFAHDDNRALHPVGVEYDRPWIRSVLGGNLQYVSEVLPLLVLSGPMKFGLGGQAMGARRKNQYGFGMEPLGFRLLWRAGGLLQPYFGVKAGAAYFNNRIQVQQGTRTQFIAEFSVGAEKALSSRWGFRAGLSDFHMANAGFAPHKAASDFLYFNGGLSYRF